MPSLTALAGARDIPNEYHINVVAAAFGDLEVLDRDPPYDPATLSGPRFCNAVRAIRTECQGQKSCLDPSGPVDPAKPKPERLTISADNLCGFDPLPYAARRVKGLVVAYQCINAEQPVWQRLELEPGLYLTEEEKARLITKQVTKVEKRSRKKVVKKERHELVEIKERTRSGLAYPTSWAILRTDNKSVAIRCQARLD